MFDRYILDGHTPVPCADWYAWGAWFERATRHVGDTTVGDARVSTVFLAIDHDMTGAGPPVLFETMIFAPDGHPLDGYTERYATWEEAEAGHAAIVATVKKEGSCRTH